MILYFLYFPLSENNVKMDIQEKKYFIIQNLKSEIHYTLNTHFKNEDEPYKLYSDTYLLLLKEINESYKEYKKLSMPTCEHIFKSGSRKGSKCTISVKEGAKLCSKHKPKVLEEDIEELPLENKQANKEKSKETIYAIRKNNFNNFVFKNTRLIFKSQKEKYIVAKEGLKGEWLPLTDEDIETCKENHLRYKIIDFTKTSTESNKEIVKTLFKLPFENKDEKI